MNTKSNLHGLSPWYISGLTQADGSFFCIVSKKANALFGLQFRPKFTLTQDLDSIGVLKSIQTYFGCGNIHVNYKTNSAELVVDNKTDLLNIIIPHFLLYPVVLDKLHSFNLFVQVVTILVNNTHRTVEERKLLLNIVLSMNSSSQRSIKVVNALYANLGVIYGSTIPLISNIFTTIDSYIEPAFILGFFDGDGSFSISFNKDGSIKPFVSLVGSVTIVPLLEGIMASISNVGTISINGTVARWLVSGGKQIREIIIPFVDNGYLHTNKVHHYEIFRESCFILAKSGITLEDRLRVVDLAYDMNKQGKRRNITKQEYIDNLINKNIPIHEDIKCAIAEVATF